MGTSHSTVVAVSPGESLPEALKTSPKAGAPALVVFTCAGDPVRPELITWLQLALTSDRVCAAEPVFVADELLQRFGTNFAPEVTASASQCAVVVFSAEAIRRNLPLILESAGPSPSAADVSVVLNMLGLTSIKVAAPMSLAPQHCLQTHGAPVPRPWDSYISQTSRSFQAFPESSAIHFADHLASTETFSVLIDARGLPEHINGTSRLALGLLQHINDEIQAGRLDWKVTALTSEDALNSPANRLDSLDLVCTVTPDAAQFDLGVSVTPIVELSRCTEIVRNCTRWVALQLDIIAIRSIPHLSQHLGARAALEFTNDYADLVVSISAATKADVTDYLARPVLAQQAVSHLGVPDVFPARTSRPAEVDPQTVLVLGNDDPHKRTRPTVAALTTAGYRVTSITSRAPVDELHRVVTPGSLSDEELLELIERNAAVVFPSEYEGFGLPLIEVAATGKPVIAWNTAVNKELIDAFGLQRVHLVADDDMLVQAVRTAVSAPPQSALQLRRMSEFHQDFLSLLSDVLESPLDLEKLNARWQVARLIHSSAEEAAAATHSRLVDSGQTSLKHMFLERVRARFSRT